MRRLGGLLVLVLFLSNSLLAVTEEKNEIAKRFSQAQELVKQGHLKQAVLAYQAIIDSNPKIPESYNNLAAIYLKQKKIKQAKSVLEKGLTAHKGYGALYEGLSVINIALAKEAYSKALQIDLKPDNISIADLALSENSLNISQNALVASAATQNSSLLNLVKTLVADSAESTLTETSKAEIELLLKAWSAGWTAQSADIYLSFYHQNFLPENNVSRSRWEKSRQLRLRKPKWIKVSISDIEIKPLSAEQAIVNFKQIYQSNSFDDISLKKMVLLNTNNGWQILREKSL